MLPEINYDVESINLIGKIMAQGLSGAGGRKFAVVDYDLSVNQHEVKALRILVGLGVGGLVLYARRIEQHQVGSHAFAQ
jgi:hypothetical protein